MARTLQACAEVIAGKRHDAISVEESIQFLNATSPAVLDENAKMAESILKYLVKGCIALARKGDAAGILSLLKFFPKANQNDKWLLAGHAQVLPVLYPLGVAFLGDFCNLRTNELEKASLKKFSPLFTSKECIEFGTQVFELSVDFCDVMCDDSEKQMTHLAKLACASLFQESSNRENEDDRDYACAIDCLRRSASYVLANVTDSFPNTISGVYDTLKDHRKELMYSMLQSSEASIQRSLIRFVSILYKFKKGRKFGFPEIRNSVASLLRKHGKKSKISESLLALFQRIDVTHEDSALQVENFRRTAAEYLGYTSCLVTNTCSVFLVDVKNGSEYSLDAASTDWDENSFSIQHENLNRLRVPWHHVKYVEWNKTGNDLSLQASHSFLKVIRIGFKSNRFQNNSMAQKVYSRLQQYRVPTTSYDLNIEQDFRSVRKFSRNETTAESTPTTSSPVYKIGKTTVDSPFVLEDTVFSGLLGDGVLLSRELTGRSLHSVRSADVRTNVHSPTQRAPLRSTSSKGKKSEGCPSTSLKQNASTSERAAAKETAGTNFRGTGSTSKDDRIPAKGDLKSIGRGSTDNSIEFEPSSTFFRSRNGKTAKRALDMKDKVTSVQSPRAFRKVAHDIPDVLDTSPNRNSLPGNGYSRKPSTGEGIEVDDLLAADSSGESSAHEDVNTQHVKELKPAKSRGEVGGRSVRQGTHDAKEHENGTTSCGSSSQSSELDDINGDVHNERIIGSEEDSLPVVARTGGISGRDIGGALGKIGMSPRAVTGAQPDPDDDGAIDSYVSADDDGTEFTAKLLQVVESTRMARKEGTKTLIEKTRRKVERIRASALKAKKEAIASFAKLVQQEFDRERGKISECQQEFSGGLRDQLVKLRELDEKKTALEGEMAKLKKGAVKKIGEANKELAVTQERLAGNLRSTYEANMLRRQALHQSDHLFRGISELLTSNELE